MTAALASTDSRRRFYVGMACLLLVVNFIGFAPSYFLMSRFDAPSLPPRTHVHGPIFVGWFLLFLAQATLIARGSRQLHRRLGVAGAVLAAVMVVSGLVMIIVRAGEYRPTGGTDDAEALAGTATVVFANLHLLASFAIFAGLGVVYRRRPRVHKRCMLLASLSMMPQSIGRIAGFPALAVSPVPFALGSLLVLLCVPVIHDWLTLRRVHPVNAWGPLLFFATLVISAAVLPATGFGQRLVAALAELQQ